MSCRYIWWVAVIVLPLGLGLVPQPAPAQQPSSVAGVRGYVYDSLLTGTTVPGARVFLRGPTAREITADGRGRYLADSLQPGRYLITFTHSSFEAVGYSPPERVVELRAGVVTPLMLATPLGHDIYAQLCPRSPSDQSGAVLGHLSNVATNRPVVGGEVRVEWSESLVSRELGLTRRMRAVQAATDSSGRYLLCGVPIDTKVLFRARVNAVDGPPLELDMKGRLIAVRALTVSLGDTAAGTPAADPRGTAIVRGRIRSSDGAPVVEAQVLVLGLEGGTRTSPTGTFELGELPGGTHTVEIRAIGFGRRRELVDLHPERPAEIDVRLARVAMALPEIEVKGRAALAEFDQRRQGGAGHFITQEEIERINPFRTEDLFRRVPGFNVVPSGGFDYQVVSTRGPGMAGSQCAPDFFVDGARIVVDPQIAGGLPVNPTEIYGIETYSGPATVPAQFQSQTGCGSVVIWTRRGAARRR